MRHLNRFAVFGCALVLVSGACSNSGSPSSSTPTTVDHPPASFEAGPCPTTLEPVPLLDGAHCGSLVVPENRSKADGRTIRLAVATVPSETQPPTGEPILFITGGPGQSGIAYPPVPENVGINHNRDLILISLRGTELSEPTLACPDIYKFMVRRIGLVYDAPSTGDAYAQAVRECKDRIGSSADLTAFNTTEAVYDLVDLRKALGIEGWDVFGHSYGTDVALSYIREDAAAIRSVVLDGVAPPSAVNITWLGVGANEGIDDMMKACEAQPACKQRYPDLRATFIRLVNQLEKNPVTTTVDVPGTGATKVVIDGGTLLNWATSATHFSADFPAAIDELDYGNPQPIAARWASSWIDGEKFQPLAWGLFLSVVCREWVPFQSVDDQLRQAWETFPDFPASVQAQTPQVPFIREGCAVWNVPKAPDSTREVTKSDIPTLVLSGSFDGQTGAQFGTYAAKDLSKSTVVVMPGSAHGVYSEPCGAQVVASYFDNHQKPDTSCVDSTEPAPFNILPPRQ